MKQDGVTKEEYLRKNITMENVIELGLQTAIKALKVVYAFSCDKYIVRLIKDLYADKHNAHNVEHTVSDGYDYAQIASIFYSDYIGKPLSDIANEDSWSKDNKPLIYVACLRSVTRYIKRNQRMYHKFPLLHDNLIEPREVQLSSESVALGLEKVAKNIEAMKLTPVEMKVLDLRFAGNGCKLIAKELSRN